MAHLLCTFQALPKRGEAEAYNIGELHFSIFQQGKITVVTQSYFIKKYSYTQHRKEMFRKILSQKK